MANAITKNPHRQEKHFAYVDFTYANVNSTSFTPAVELPGGSVVTGGALTITTGFGSGNTVTVGDATDGDRYLATSSNNAETAQRFGFSPTGFVNTGTTNVGVTFSSAPSAGAARLEIEYYIEDRATSVQGS